MLLVISEGMVILFPAHFISFSPTKHTIGVFLFACTQANIIPFSALPDSYHQQRSMVNNQDEKLGVIAREAKVRLHERLRAQYRNSEPKRRNSQERVRVMDLNQDQDHDKVNSATASAATGGGLKKSVSKKMMSWAKFSSWKSSEQNECAYAWIEKHVNFGSCCD